MANGLEKIKRTRLVFGQSSPLLKTALAAVIALSTVTLLTMRLTEWNKQDEYQRLQQQAAQLERENADLQARIDGLGTVESIRQIAAEKLDLVDPNTVIIDSE